GVLRQGDEGDDPGAAHRGRGGDGADAAEGAGAGGDLRRADGGADAGAGRAVGADRRRQRPRRQALPGQAAGRDAQGAGGPAKGGRAVIDAATRDLLQEIVRREKLSMLSYVGDAYPWATSREGAALAKLRKIVHSEGEAVAGLGRYLVRKKVPLGFIGSYP